MSQPPPPPSNLPQPPINTNPSNSILPIPPNSVVIAPPRVDFEEFRYEAILAQKGVDVLVEKALQCPCKTDSINQLSTCKNCGGTGWIFVNARKTRLLIQGVGVKKTDDVWSSFMQGTAKISFLPDEELAFMDRITRLNAKSIFTEIIEFIPQNNKVFGFLTYQPKVIDFLGLYQIDTQPLLPVDKANFTVTNNRIDLINVDLSAIDENNPLTATIRYTHAPTFNIIDVDREPLDNYKWTGKGEQLQELPGKALARRTHNIDDLVKLRQGKLLNNDYNELHCTC